MESSAPPVSDRNTSSLASKTTRGLKWSAIEKISNQGLTFGIQILLARLVDPREFGLLTLIVIFTTLARLIVNSGFSQALIQKKDVSKLDSSTTFVFNVCISLVMYGALYAVAPWIANFYGEPRLTSLLRVVSLTLVIASLGIVQQALLIRTLSFKKLFFVSVPSLTVGGAIGIWMAVEGWEVWSLVAFQLARETIATACYWFWADRDLRPGIAFSLHSFKNLGRFGMGIFGASLFFEGVQNIYGLMIGKFFSFGDLAFYNRARSFHRAPAMTVSAILGRVLFPVFSTIQEDNQRIVKALRRGVPLLSFTIFPFMCFLICASESIVIVVLTEKWLPAAELMKWFPIVGMIYPLATISTSVIQAKGLSGLVFWLSVLKNGLGIIVLAITLQIGVREVVIGQVAVSVVSYVLVNSLVYQRVLGYRLIDQLKDTLPYLLNSAAAMIVVALIDRALIGANAPTMLVSKLFIFSICYLLLCRVVHLGAYDLAQQQLVYGLKSRLS